MRRMIPFMVGVASFISAGMAWAQPSMVVSPADMQAQGYFSGEFNAGSGWQGTRTGTGWGGTFNGANMGAQANFSGRVDAWSANEDDTQPRRGWGSGNGWGGNVYETKSGTSGNSYTTPEYQGGWVWEAPRFESMTRVSMVMENSWSRSGATQRQPDYNRNWPVSRSLQIGQPGNNGQHAVIW